MGWQKTHPKVTQCWTKVWVYFLAVVNNFPLPEFQSGRSLSPEGVLFQKSDRLILGRAEVTPPGGGAVKFVRLPISWVGVHHSALGPHQPHRARLRPQCGGGERAAEGVQQVRGDGAQGGEDALQADGQGPVRDDARCPVPPAPTWRVMMTVI